MLKNNNYFSPKYDCFVNNKNFCLLFLLMFFVSKREIKIIDKNAKLTENNAGYLYGKIGFSKPKISTQTVGPIITSEIELSSPINPPI